MLHSNLSIVLRIVDYVGWLKLAQGGASQETDPLVYLESGMESMVQPKHVQENTLVEKYRGYRGYREL